MVKNCYIYARKLKILKILAIGWKGIWKSVNTLIFQKKFCGTWKHVQTFSTIQRLANN